MIFRHNALNVSLRLNKCRNIIHQFQTITVQRRRIWQEQPSTTISFEVFRERKARFQPVCRHCRTNSSSFGSAHRNGPRPRRRRP